MNQREVEITNTNNKCEIGSMYQMFNKDLYLKKKTKYKL